MKITLGEWRMRCGGKAIVGAINESSIEPVIGWRPTKDGILVCRTWQSCGRYYKEESENEFDLIAPWTEPVPWDWSTTPPWINWIAMWKDGDWLMFDGEPVINHLNNGWVCSGDESVSHFIPYSHAPKWSGDWKLSKTQRPKEVAK